MADRLSGFWRGGPQSQARAKARIAELERKVGKQQMDLDFFREALRLIDALETKTSATSSTRSSKR